MSYVLNAGLGNLFKDVQEGVEAQKKAAKKAVRPSSRFIFDKSLIERAKQEADFREEQLKEEKEQMYYGLIALGVGVVIVGAYWYVKK